MAAVLHGGLQRQSKGSMMLASFLIAVLTVVAGIWAAKKLKVI